MTLGPDNIYMFPRRDCIVLGGSFQRGESNTTSDPAITGADPARKQGPLRLEGKGQPPMSLVHVMS
jgi:hypothetical protein